MSDGDRPPGMPADIDPGVPGDAVAATFDCGTCGRWAMRVMLLGGPRALGHILDAFEDAGSVVTDSGLGSRIAASAAPEPITTRHGPSAVRDAIERADAAALYRIDLEMVPAWCPACERAYCADHWRTWEVFDEDAPWWHDSTRGLCPHGHERMIFD